MPVEFLTDDQVAAYGGFEEELSVRELERFCWLSDSDQAVVNRRRRDHNRLGFAVQLATVRLLGRFLPEPLEVPSSLVQFLAVQLDVGDVSVVAAYGQRLPTQHAHAREIRGRYGYVDLGDVEAAGGLSSFLRARAWTSTEGPTQLFERAVLWLRERKVLLPGVSVLTRLVSEVRAEQAARLHDAIAASVDDQLLGSLDGLLAVTSGRVSDLERLRTGPSRASAPEVLRQHDRFGELARLRVDTIDLSALPAGRVALLGRYGMSAKAGALRDLAPERRQATLIATLHMLLADVADDLCDAFDLIVSQRVLRRATRDSTAAQARTLPRLSKASRQLATAMTVVLDVLGDNETATGDVRRLLQERINLADVRAALAIVADCTEWTEDENTASEMIRRFATIRAFLPSLAGSGLFGATDGGAAVLAALVALADRLVDNDGSFDGLDRSIIAPAWSRLIERAGKTERRAYTLAVTSALHSALRRRDVYAVNGIRWGDPRARLLSDQAWAESGDELLAGLQLPAHAEVHLEAIAGQLDTAYRFVAEQVPTSSDLRVDNDGRATEPEAGFRCISQSSVSLYSFSCRDGSTR